MNMIILGLLMSCLTIVPTGCSGSHQKNTNRFTGESHTITITDSIEFLRDIGYLMITFNQACRSAVNPYIQLEYSYNDNSGYAFYYLDNENYIVLLLSPDQRECVIVTFCVDGTINYKKFRDYMITACEQAENPWDAEITES